MLFAYFGPETTLPFASVLATIVGFVLMFGRQSLRLIGIAARRVGRSVGLGARKPVHGAAPHLFNRRAGSTGRNGLARDESPSPADRPEG